MTKNEKTEIKVILINHTSVPDCSLCIGRKSIASDARWNQCFVFAIFKIDIQLTQKDMMNSASAIARGERQEAAGPVGRFVLVKSIE